jgi:CheY-like chemotaxis protein
LDINVPNIDGIKILKKIREYYEIVPVIIISASVELDVIKQSYDFEMCDENCVDNIQILLDDTINLENNGLLLTEKNNAIIY